MSNITTTQINGNIWKLGKSGNIEFCGNFIKLREKEPKVAALLLGHEQQEGHECEDSEYRYKIYHSQYGYSVGRRKKPVPDTVNTSMEENTLLPKTSHNANPVMDQTSEIMKLLHDLTYTMNCLVLATLATSEAERNIVKARLSRSE
jgi:hypothetical protein